MPKMSKLGAVAAGVLLFHAAVLNHPLHAQPRSPSVPLPKPDRRPAAPDFPQQFKWLNTDQPLQLGGNLKGHVVILDFWTYC